MSLKLEHFQAVITGRVQGVGFRYATFGEAKRLGLRGWVKNLPTGDVEVLAEGTTEALDELLNWLHQGPVGARVDRVEVRTRAPSEASAFSKFEIRR